ncbi:MAG: anti-sigma factor family protein [Maricaulaceae bacterium]
MSVVRQIRRALRLSLQKAGVLLTCEEFEAFVADFHEGRLDPTTRAKFELHLAFCPDCTDYLAAYQRSVAAAKSALTPQPNDPPPQAPQALIEAVLAAREAGSVAD